MEVLLSNLSKTIISLFSLLLITNDSFAKSFTVDGHSVETDDSLRSGTYTIDGKEFVHSGAIQLKRSEMFRAIPGTDRSDDSLYIVQFETKIFPSYKTELEALGLEVIKYVPDHSLLVKGHGGQLDSLYEQEFVKEVYDFSGDYKVAGLSRSLWLQPSAFSQGKYDVLPIDNQYREEILNEAINLGAQIVHTGEESFALTINASLAMVEQLSTSPYVLWIEQAPERIEEDMDIVLEQGGATMLIQTTGTYRGEGITGHVLEGIYKDHPDFAADDYRKAPFAVGNDAPSSHGQKTYGIIYGSGKGDKTATGLMPRAQGIFTSYNHVYNKDNRLELTKELIEKHQVMLQTASWGYPQKTEYDARSLEMDQIIFETDMPITQSQSNTRSRRSRPQAWAKNIISVGAVFHGNNKDFSDDSWGKGGASIGPASDNRIKPDIVSYYDKIHTTGNTGYGPFGGTSGATPIINGHIGLIIEMFTDGIFGNELEFPKKERFKNRPHATTTKALLINSARQYDFKGLDHDLTRIHQGWGHPNLRQLYEQREKMLIVDESITLKAMEDKVFELEVGEDEPQLAATLIYNDPPGMVGAKVHRVNDMDLIVTDPKGQVYYGNNGLYENKFSVPGGETDGINTVENVIVKEPMAGTWTVRVLASEINQDGHVETEEMDSDFALVVSGLKKQVSEEEQE